MRDRAVVQNRSPRPHGRLRAARTVVFSLREGEVVGFNFLSRQEFCCDPDLLRFIAACGEWTSADAIAEEGGASEEALEALVEIGVLVEEGSQLCSREAAFASGWTWGLPTALMHFSLDGATYLSLEASERRQIEKSRTEPSPPLWQTNNGLRDVRALEPALPDGGLLDLMARRRTVREAAGIISLRELTDCLFAGMGITGETENCVGKLPLSMTPSGGARNPFEAYVFARAVAGLTAGVYHYSATEHSLGRVGEGGCPDLAGLVGGQDWARDMPALVVLAARMERPMWKYENGNAYRVMLIEAGHIGQNVMLAAVNHGLTACPTAALSHDALRAALGLCPVMDAPVYALAIGRP